jgi:hypothetical protein
LSLLSLFRTPKAQPAAPVTPGEQLGLLTHRNCPVCAVDDPIELQRFEDYQFFADGTPRVTVCDVQCRRCFTIYKNPTYTVRGMEVLFAQASRSYGAEHPAARVAEQVAWMAQHGLLEDVIDYGCASGGFLAGLPPGRRLGLDVDAGAIAEARARHPDIAFVHMNPDGRQNGAWSAETVVTLPFWPQVLTLWHTLEHLAYPGAVLDEFHHASPCPTYAFAASPRPACALALEVPILEMGFTDDVCGFLSVQHTTHFSRRSLHNLLWRRGWQAEVIEDQAYNGRRVLARQVSPATTVSGDPADGALAAGYLAHHRTACAKVDARFQAGVGRRAYVLWGAGMHTEALYHETSLAKHLPGLILDSDPGKQGTAWRDVMITAPNVQIAKTIKVWNMPLVISSYGSQRDIVAAALALGVPESCIVTLYDNPVVY